MTKDTSNLLADEDEMEESSQITLYKELIRILEKDVDDAQSRSTREGWNTWGIWGAIVGGALLLLGQTKDLNEIPAQTQTISITAIVLFQFALGAYNVFIKNKNIVKERRLLDSKQLFKAINLLLLIRLIVLIGVSIVIYFSDYSEWIKIVSIFLLLTPIFYIATASYISSRIQVLVGNNPRNRNYGSLFAYLVLLFQLIAIILLGYDLRFPVGQELSAAYTIGLSLSAIIILVEISFSNSAPSDATGELQDLRDDIIFRRAGLNEALGRYQILKEGKSLYDEMKSDLDVIMNLLHFEEENYTEQSKIVSKLSVLLDSKRDSETATEDENEQTEILVKSLNTYVREMDGLIAQVIDRLNPFYKKLKNAANASGDAEAENLIVRLIQQRIGGLTDTAGKIAAEKAALQERAAKLSLEIADKPKTSLVNVKN